MPSVYQMLPSYPNAVINGNAGNGTLDIFQLGSWQSNTYDPGNKPYIVTQGKLDAAKNFIDNGMISPNSMDKNNTLIIYGGGEITAHQVTAKDECDIKFKYDFVNVTAGDGDGTVLAESALIPSLPSIRLLKSSMSAHDAALVTQMGLHGSLPALDVVITSTKKFFKGEKKGAAILPVNVNPDCYRAGQ